MKRLLAVAAVVFALGACAAQGDDDSNADDQSVELGSAAIALETSTPTHAYRLGGTLQVWRNGVQQQNVDLTGAAASVSIPNLTPGEYWLYLENPNLTRDGTPYASTLVGPNPFPVVVTAGEVTAVPISFTLVGDPPVTFQPGAINVSISVTEVPPS